MQVKLSNFSNYENPIITLYRAYRVCYSRGKQSEIKLPITNTGAIDYEAMTNFITSHMNHVSPLEHVSFTFEISGVSRALTHQLVRHRTGKYSQQSQRYVKLGQFEYVIPPSIQADPELKARFIEEMERDQEAYDFFVYKLITNQIKDSNLSVPDPNNHDQFKLLYPKYFKTFEKYAIEDARYVFSNACASNITCTMDLGNFRKFYALRYCTHAQWEIRELARLMGKEVVKVLPFALRGAMNCNKTCFDCVGRAEE